MAIPNTNGPWSLDDVRIEVGNATGTSLIDAFNSSVDDGFDVLYKGDKDNLLNFRNYNHAPRPSNNQTIGFNSSSNKVFTFTVTSADKVAVLCVTSSSVFTITSIVDSTGETWFLKESNDRLKMYYNNNLSTTGSRTVTVNTTETVILGGILTYTDCSKTVGDSTNAYSTAVNGNLTMNFTPTDLDAVNVHFGFNNDSVVNLSNSAGYYFEDRASYGTGALQIEARDLFPRIQTSLAFGVAGVFGNGTQYYAIASMEIYPTWSADTTPPAQVAQPTATNIQETTFTLSWTATTDNKEVIGYKVYKNGTLYSDVGDVLTVGITGQTAGSTANWTVTAYDSEGNESTPSTARSVTMDVGLTAMYITSISYTTSAGACGQTVTELVYHDGAGTFPAANDFVYTDSGGTTVFVGDGDHYGQDDTDNTAATTTSQIASNGRVSNPQICL